MIYLNELIVFSKKRGDHLRDLEKVLKRCQEHDISLNPKKSFFYITKGRFLSHIVSHEGIQIDHEHMKVIQQLNLQASKSRAKFSLAFCSSLFNDYEMYIDMMKGSQNFKWNDSRKKAFKLIKHSSGRGCVLIHPDYTKEFILYCYALARAHYLQSYHKKMMKVFKHLFYPWALHLKIMS